MRTGRSDLARAALELLLTRGEVVGAVDYCVSSRPGFELARSVLALLQRWSALLRCPAFAAWPVVGRTGSLSIDAYAAELMFSRTMRG